MFEDITVLLGDPTLPDASKPGGRFTDDDHFQVEKLREALGALPGRRFHYLNDHRHLLDRLREQPPAFVLNFCDTGYANEARRELHVPALLELLGIPYSGSGPVALGLCYDKALVRAIAAAAGVPVPDEVLLRGDEPLPPVSYPAFVKPNRGDGSVGITEAAIVADAAAAERRIAALRAELPGCDVLVQQFLGGAEYGLGLVGNPDTGLAALPMLEVDYSALDPSLPRLLSYASKVDPDSPYWTDIRFRRAGLAPAEQERLRAHCASLWGRLQLRDYARFDFRADAAGTLRLMEVNPNPAWCWDGKLAHMAAQDGLSHGDLLGRIIEAAEHRLGA